MTNKVNTLRFLTLSLAIGGFLLVSGSLTETFGQRDPFSKPGWARKPEPGKGGKESGKPQGPPVDLGAPAIQMRIDYYKRQREAAAAAGQPIPKVTSVLTLNEMSVTGIFRTPRGYAAMVIADPLQLSYTIYPGEKFFDGQLVAVEENRLVFRRVVKMSDGKFVSSVENKPLRKYTQLQEVQGMNPNEATAQTTTTQPPVGPPANVPVDPKATGPIVSPLEEMNRKVPEVDKSKSKKSARVAQSR